ncbi:MAG: 50S ribosomal protein L28 [Patescibacteria group bacterium]
MAKVCALCQRGALKGNKRSHSNIATKRRQYLNLQKIKKDGKSIMVCTSCIRNQSKKVK